MLSFIKGLFGIEEEKEEKPKKLKKVRPVIRYFYARDGKKNERVVSVARRTMVEKGIIQYAWCMNDPRYDKFSKKVARKLLKEKLDKSPIEIPMIDGIRPIWTVATHISDENKDIPETAKKLVNKWLVPS